MRCDYCGKTIMQKHMRFIMVACMPYTARDSVFCKRMCRTEFMNCNGFIFSHKLPKDLLDGPKTPDN